MDRYARARARLAEIIGSEGLAIVPAATEMVRNYDVHHLFHQDTEFWYLTGFPEPDAVAVIAPEHEDGEFVLFVRPKDPTQEVWTGIRAGTEGAKEGYGADEAYEIGELDDVLQKMMLGREVIWYETGNDRLDDKISTIIEKARSMRETMGRVVPSSVWTVPSTVRDPSGVLAEMMLFKGEDEANSLRRACEISAQGHIEAMRFARPGLHEYEVQAAMEYRWRMAGARHNGYPSIVAAGANACILHYIENDSVIGDDDLLLIDAAAEIDGYSSDITRTFPANGRFSGPQRAMYEVVLEAQKKGVAMSSPGGSMGDIHLECTRILAEGMVELGLLPGPIDQVMSMHHYTEFYMHGTGHWLGLDVHDRSAYSVLGKPRPLEPGMAFTVEPGLYVGPDKAEIELTMLPYDHEERAERRLRLGTKKAMALEAEEKESAEKIVHEVPGEFLGIGIRIEDDILITKDGHENLSEFVPREISEIEALCAEPSALPSL